MKNHTMTSGMCLLLCAAPAFDAEAEHTGKGVFRLPRLLQNFASAVYFRPYKGTDGSEHADMFRTEGRIQYYSGPRKIAMDYLLACDDVMAEDADTGAILDKPNAHRCRLYTSPSPRDLSTSRMPSSA